MHISSKELRAKMTNHPLVHDALYVLYWWALARAVCTASFHFETAFFVLKKQDEIKKWWQK